MPVTRARRVAVTTVLLTVLVFGWWSRNSRPMQQQLDEQQLSAGTSLETVVSSSPAATTRQLCDRDSCSSLLSASCYSAASVWAPGHCSVATYNSSLVSRCLRRRPAAVAAAAVVFSGDSRMRMLFGAAVAVNLPDVRIYTEPEHQQLAARDLQVGHNQLHQLHGDLRAEGSTGQLLLQFIWNPLLDDGLATRVQHWLDLPAQARPLMLVLGAGIWHLCSPSAEEREQNVAGLAARLAGLATQLDALSATTHVVWHLYYHTNPLRPHPMFTPADLQRLNSEVIRALSAAHVSIWDGHFPLTERYYEMCRQWNFPVDDHFSWLCSEMNHLGYIVLDHLAQILYNYLCNGHVTLGQHTCCAAATPDS